MDEIIIITAGTSGWIREHFSPSAIVRQFGEGLIGDYRSKMEALRKIDDTIAVWTSDLDTIIKQATNALESGRLVSVAMFLGSIDRKLKSVSDFQKQIEEVRQEAIRTFEQKRNEYFPLDFEKETGLHSSAGFYEDIKRKFVHRRFRSDIQYKAIKELIDKTKVIVKKVQEQLKFLGNARASGHINQYIKGLEEISKLQREFHNSFAPIYHKYLKDSVQKAIEEEKAKQVENTPDTTPSTVKEQIPATVPNKPLSIDPETIPNTISDVKPSLPVPLSKITTPPNNNSPNNNSPNTEDKDLNSFLQNKYKFDKGPESHDEDLKEDPQTIPDPPFSPPTSRSPALAQAEHRWFINQLFKAAKEDRDPYILASMIVDYSGKVEGYDQDKSLELLAIAEGILDNE